MPLLKKHCPSIISPTALKELEQLGITTVEGFLKASPKQLRSDQEEYSKIKSHLISIYSAQLLQGYEELERAQEGSTFSTGCTELDNQLLFGGIFSGQLTEFVGPSASGKTQICMCAAVEAAGSEHGGTVLYIDTMNSFSAQRLLQIAQTRKEKGLIGIPVNHTLSRIRCIHAFNAHTLIKLLVNIMDNIKAENSTFYSSLKMLIIDSIGGIMSPIVGIKDQKGQLILNHISRLLKRIAVEHDIAVIITNYTVTSGDGKIKAALGESWTHISNTQVMLQFAESGMDGLRNAFLTKSCTKPVNVRVQFVIDDSGISDAPYKKK